MGQKCYSVGFTHTNTLNCNVLSHLCLWPTGNKRACRVVCCCSRLPLHQDFLQKQHTTELWVCKQRQTVITVPSVWCVTVAPVDGRSGNEWLRHVTVKTVHQRLRLLWTVFPISNKRSSHSNPINIHRHVWGIGIGFVDLWPTARSRIPFQRNWGRTVFSPWSIHGSMCLSDGESVQCPIAFDSIQRSYHLSFVSEMDTPITSSHWLVRTIL